MKLLRFTLPVLLLLSSLGLFAQTPSAFCFTLTSSPSASTSPAFSTSGDFNLDGIKDLAIANSSANSVSILLGTGGGSFAAAINYPVGYSPVCIVKGDFNNDGKQDLATANNNGNNFSVLLNQGLGTFAAAVNYSTGSYPRYLVTADFSGDGKLDIVVANQGSNTISIFIGTGTGTFGAPNNYPVGTTPYALAVGDFDANTILDVMVLNSGSNDMWLLSGSGTGSFSGVASPAVPLNSYGMTTADFNGDSSPDIAITSNPNTVNIFLASGGVYSTYTTYYVGSNPSSVVAGDFNVDGYIDLAVSNASSDDINMLLGSSTGTFTDASYFSTGMSPLCIMTDDFNNDSRPDLVTANAGANNASVFLNLQSPNIIASASTATAVCYGTPIVMNATGATTYTWSTGATSTSISVIPGYTQTYTVTGTAANGCVNQATQNVTIYAVPTVDITPTSITICSGTSTTLNVNGSAITYTWSTGANTTSVSVAPAINTTYSVTGTGANGCSYQGTAMVFVNPSPVASAVTNAPICVGGNLIFSNTSTGASIYSWTGPNSFSSTLANPSITSLNGSETGNYVLQVTSVNGCVSSTVLAVTVNPAAIVGVSASSPSVCAGSTVTVSAFSANTYTWLPGSLVGANQTYSPTVSTTYTVTGSTAAGCTKSNNITVSVTALTNMTGTATALFNPVAGKATLYRYEPFLTKFDSVTTQPFNGAGVYTFTSVPEGSYIVKAIPTASTLQVTYGNNSISWQSAHVTTQGCAVDGVQNISVVPFATITPGPGLLSGTITEGLGFGQRPSSIYSPLAPGSPIGGIVVKGGKNPGGSMFAQTTTSSLGTYTLAGLPANAAGESYFILVDIPGLDTNNTYHKVITLSNNQYTGLDFVVDSAKVNPIPSSATGIKTMSNAVNQIQLYPNPAKNKVSIQYSLQSTSLVSIEIIDIIGQTVKTVLPAIEQSADNYRITAPLEELKAGMYFVKVKINHLESTLRFMITD
ncbi:MAG: FG-GAP-like repeat-containing protein [Bacteroidota bacterium]